MQGGPCINMSTHSFFASHLNTALYNISYKNIHIPLGCRIQFYCKLYNLSCHEKFDEKESY